MTDPVFEKFRRELADVVTVAINTGRRVGCTGFATCPLGCHSRAAARPPSAALAARWFDIPVEAAISFAWTFDGDTPSDAAQYPQYAELARLYRERFP